MHNGQLIAEQDLHALAKEARESTGITQVDAARELGVQQPTLAQAENEPERNLTKLRLRMIERFSAYEVEGPLYRLKKRDSK